MPTPVADVKDLALRATPSNLKVAESRRAQREEKSFEKRATLENLLADAQATYD
jgi:ribosomal protein L9